MISEGVTYTIKKIYGKKIINNKTYIIIQVSVTYLLLSKVHYSKIITKLQKHSSFNDLYHMTIYDNLDIFLFRNWTLDE